MKLDSVITLDISELQRKQWAKLLAKLTFYDADDEEIQAYDVRPSAGIVILPRGVRSMLPRRLQVLDMRSRPEMPKVEYTRTLDERGYGGQAEAVALMYEHEQGQIVIPPGGGKTEIGLAFAAGCGTRTLVIVHTKDLFKQWVERAQAACPDLPLGKIVGRTCQVGHLTIAMAQTLKRYLGKGGKFWRQFGCLIVDESHHGAAETWEWLLNSCPAFYRFGLTATERRADGRHPLVTFLIGPVLKKVEFQSQVPLAVQPITTGFGFKKVVYRGPNDWTRMLRRLSIDESRNTRIAKLVVRELKAGHSILVLSRQIKHLEGIYDNINLAVNFDEGWMQYVKVLTGRIGQNTRDEMMEDFRQGRLRVVLATQLADEGLDVPRLDRVFLTFPGKHDGRIIQQIGRAIRQYPDKTDALIYDMVDDLIPPLARQYVSRKRTYNQLGIQVKKARGYGFEKKKGRTIRGHFKVARSGRDQETD